MEPRDLLNMTAEIVSAYVSNNQARASELPELVATVHAALTGITAPQPIEEPAPELKPAVPVKKSIHEDYLICLDDGKKFKSLKRHLAQLGMTPDEYRAKWGLPRDYPMVAPGYAMKRSELAKLSGLGSNRRGGAELAKVEASAEAEEPVQAEAEEANSASAEATESEPVAAAVPEVSEEAPKRRGRRKKAA